MLGASYRAEGDSGGGCCKRVISAPSGVRDVELVVTSVDAVYPVPPLGTYLREYDRTGALLAFQRFRLVHCFGPIESPVMWAGTQAAAALTTGSSRTINTGRKG